MTAIEKNAEYRGQPEILTLVHVIERPITAHYGDSDKDTVFGEFFTDLSGTDILYYPEKYVDKGELIKAGHYVLLRRTTLLSQPENEKVYSLGDYVAVCFMLAQKCRPIVSEFWPKFIFLLIQKNNLS